MSKFVGEKVLMRIFTGETKMFGDLPLYEALINLFRREGFAGVTVLRGVSGFGAHGVYHDFKLLELSSDLPMILEVVESQEKIDSVLPKVDKMIESGMITLEKVNVILYTHRHAEER